MLFKEVIIWATNNKSAVLGFATTISSSLLSHLEQLGAIARDLSALIAVVVGLLTSIKLIIDITRGKRGKK